MVSCYLKLRHYLLMFVQKGTSHFKPRICSKATVELPRLFGQVVRCVPTAVPTMHPIASPRRVASGPPGTTSMQTRAISAYASSGTFRFSSRHTKAEITIGAYYGFIYCGFSPATFATFPHFPISLRIKSAKCSGVPPMGAAPRFSIDFDTDGVVRALFISLLT